MKILHAPEIIDSSSPTAKIAVQDHAARFDFQLWLRICTGSLVILISAAILLAWSFQSLEFVQFDPARIPPHYNDALIMLGLGIGYVGIARGRFRFARLLAITALLFGIATLADRVPGYSYGLQNWVWSASHISGANIARSQLIIPGFICLSGLLLLLLTRRAQSSFADLSILFLSVLLGPAFLCVCMMPLLGIQTPFDRLPVLILAGIMLTGAAGIANTSTSRLCPCSDRKLLPGIIVIFGIGLTLVFRDGLANDRRDRISRQVELELSQVRQRLKDELYRNQKEVMRLAESWEQWTPEERVERLGSYMGVERGCLSVARINPNLTMDWTDLSRSRNLPAKLEDTQAGSVFVEAAVKGNAVMAKPLNSPWDLVQNSRIRRRVFYVYAPCRENHPEYGGILSVLQVRDSFEPMLRTSPFATEITDAEGYLFGRFESQPGGREEWGQILPIEYPNFDGRIALWPTREALAKENLQLPEIALGLGTLLTTLLALAAYLAQKARSRAAEVEAALRERESAQVALTQSEEKYRTLIENLGQGVFLQDAQHKYVAANAEFCRTLGWQEHQLKGMTETELFDAARAAKHGMDVQKVLDEGCRVESEQEGGEGDQRVIVRQTLTPVCDSSGKTTGVLGICWDVTEQRRLEAHVLQASKMDAIGQLAGGIAHDFNNLLTAILGNLQLISEVLPPESECREFADEALTATDRAASLTKRLLGFSRKHHQLNWVSFDLPMVVDEVVHLLRRTIDPLVRIEFNKVGELPNISGDPGQFHQILMNLCINARDAIDESGLIAINLERVNISELPATGIMPAKIGDFLRLSVTDSGSGMSDEVKARIYEPFFTTKEVGKGTGLGLAMVFAIVRQHDGWIDCWSEVGKGTRFDLYLPVADAGAKKEAVRDVPPQAHHCRETILVVDDEEIVRRLAVSVLRTKGYTVLEAEDGQKAVEIYEKERDRIDLVLLDLTMPVLSGHDAFRRLLMMNPNVKVIFMSGYSSTKLTDLEKETMLGFVNKPYLPHDLVKLVSDSIKNDSFKPIPQSNQSSISSADEILISDTDLENQTEIMIASRNF